MDAFEQLQQASEMMRAALQKQGNSEMAVKNLQSIDEATWRLLTCAIEVLATPDQKKKIMQLFEERKKKP
jgi:hypothetical protein